MKAVILKKVTTIKERYIPNPDEIRTRREKSGMSLRAMAGKIGVSPTYMSFVETGKIEYLGKKTAEKLINLIGT